MPKYIAENSFLIPPLDYYNKKIYYRKDKVVFESLKPLTETKYIFYVKRRSFHTNPLNLDVSSLDLEFEYKATRVVSLYFNKLKSQIK